MVTARKKESPCELILVFWYKRHVLITWYDMLILPPLPVGYQVYFRQRPSHRSSSQNLQPNHTSLTHTLSFNYLSFIISTSVESHSFFFSVRSLIPAPRARRACQRTQFPFVAPFPIVPFTMARRKANGGQTTAKSTGGKAPRKTRKWLYPDCYHYSTLFFLQFDLEDLLRMVLVRSRLAYSLFLYSYIGVHSISNYIKWGFDPPHRGASSSTTRKAT